MPPLPLRKNSRHLIVADQVRERIRGAHPDDGHYSSTFGFLPGQYAFEMSNSIAQITLGRERCVELVSIRARRKRLVAIGNPDRLLVQIREQICPETEHDLGNRLARNWWSVASSGCLLARALDVRP